MTCITHPFVKPDTLEARSYQLSVAMRALEGNTMAVLPTGLGKTAIALLTAASRLYNDGGKILMLAPTKPLVEQHLRFFERFLAVPAEGAHSKFVMFTGDTPPEERSAAWNEASVCFATPQVVKNDLIAGRYTLRDVTLLIVDECHRAVGNYAYVYLARRYMETSEKPRILAMTASPGGQDEKVQEVMRNLGIEFIEARTEQDSDVLPYVHEREIEVVSVRLPQELGHAISDLETLIDARLKILAGLHFPVPKRQHLSMKALNTLNAIIQERIRQQDPAAFAAASVYAECMKLRHAIDLAGSQGSNALKGYLAKLAAEGASTGGSKASRRLAQDPVFVRLLDRASGWHEELHAKPALVEEFVKQQLAAHPGSRVIVFATFRDTVQFLVDRLNLHGIACERFVGQATKDAEKGLSQKKQIDILTRFREGEFPVLVATSVGEEGLDVPSTDMVIFYEAVPSEIRSIQRKGRTGRHGSGKIVVLVTKGTSDEAYRHVSASRERAMLAGIRNMGSNMPLTGATKGISLNGGCYPSRSEDTKASELTVGIGVPGPGDSVPKITSQASIITFTGQDQDRSGPEVVVDDRETSSRVVEVLERLGIRLILRRLELADYSIGDRVIIERKTTRDLMDTLVDRDLLSQVRALASAAARPVLIVEGGDIYTQRDIHPNAVRGVLAAIAIDLGVSVFFTKDAEETAQLIAVIARREEGGHGEPRLAMRKSYSSRKDAQERVIASLPTIGLKHARLLLEHFGSIVGIAEAEEEALIRVPGIGDKRAREIYALMRASYR